MDASRTRSWMACLAVAALTAATAHGQAVIHHHHYHRAFASNVIIPQARAYSFSRSSVVRVERPRRPAIEITGVTVGVVIVEQAATTTMDINLKNPGGSRQEAELVVPVPEGAVVRAFTFQGAGKEPSAKLLPKDVARKTYDSIVAKIRDPALLEFVGYNLIRSSVFPVPPRGTQKVRLTYENLLAADGNRVDYDLPRSESLDYKVPWKVSVRVKSKTRVATVYSPSHKIETRRVGKSIVSARIAADATTEPGPFKLSYLLEREGVTASLMAYPDPKIGGGYFLLLAGLPSAPTKKDGAPAIKREVTLVLDRSGSMNGEKIEQAREAALQVLAALAEGEAFNIIAYSTQVDSFAGAPVVKSAETIQAARAYLKSMRAGGGTNIHDALLEALRQKPTKGMLPVVLFLTDGLPTVGQTSEVAIRNVATKDNPHERRIFSFGVGLDVNTPLLDKIALDTRATSTYVLPKEDVEVKVEGAFKRLAGPVLASPSYRLVGPDGKPAPGRVNHVLPGRLPDLFEGDQLTVLGQYLGEKPLDFRVEGNYLGKKRTFKFTFALDKATTKNAFVPRLWASRKIAVLIDAIRDLGGHGNPATIATPATDPRLKELVDEIVRLSTEFGILTEYTAFLAREGTNLGDRDRVLLEANRNFIGRAMNTRFGLGSYNQSYNNDLQRRPFALNRNNAFYDEQMNRVVISSVQQISDRAFYRRGNRWVDSRIVQKEQTLKPKRTIEFGSEAFRKLAERLAKQGRQGCIALQGDILLVVEGEALLVKGPSPVARATKK